MIGNLFAEPVDPDLILQDTAREHQDHEIRAMASLTLGMGLDDAYFAVQELIQAARLIILCPNEGKTVLSNILSDNWCDYQRCIYFCVAGRGQGKMIKMLETFAHILEARGRADKFLREQGVKRRKLKDPYHQFLSANLNCNISFSAGSKI